MQVRKLFAALAINIAFVLGAAAQPAPTAPAAGTTASPSATPKKGSKKKASKKGLKKKSSKKSRKAVPAPAPAPKSSVDEGTRKVLESPSPAPAPALVAPAPPALEAAAGPDDNDPPVLTHTPVTEATKGKVLTIFAHAEDPSGIFGPVLYLRKRGLPATEFLPMRMTPARSGVPGDYALEISAALVGVDALEYYLEVWDNAGNGPVRAGSAESPFAIKVEVEKKIIVKPAEPTAPRSVIVNRSGAAPAIAHTAVTRARKGQSIEINARLISETGVQGATVMFRHAGEKDYKALPMGNIGGDNYTATVPASMATSDIEYYLETFDKMSNAPARAGAPGVPFVIKLETPAAALASPVAAPAEEEYTLTRFGLELDAGAPGGGGLLLLARPWWWLRFNAGLAYNVIGLGYRGGLSLSPGHWAVTPTLNFDAGHYVSGDANRFFTPSDSNPAVLSAEKSLLSHATYSFASAQIGLEFGSQRRFAFYLRGGLAYLVSSASGADITALANTKISGNTTYKVGDVKFTSVMPTVGLGFLIFVY